jgi:arylsulfatase
VPDVIDGVAQQPLDGASLLPVVDDAERRAARTQYFEMLGSRAIYHDGWKATTDHVGSQLSVERERCPAATTSSRITGRLFDLGTISPKPHDVGASIPSACAR